MDRDILRPGWPCFRFQKIWTECRNPQGGFSLSRTDRGLFVCGLECEYVIV